MSLLQEESISKTFSDINCTEIFLGQSPKAIETKTKINQWELIKLTRFCTAYETIYKMKQEKILAKDETGEELISKTYKQLIQLNIKKTNNPIKKKNGQKT